MLALFFLGEAIFVSFSDDLALVVIAKYPKNVEVYAKETVRTDKTWLGKAKLHWPMRNRKRS